MQAVKTEELFVPRTITRSMGRSEFGTRSKLKVGSVSSSRRHSNSPPWEREQSEQS